MADGGSLIPNVPVSVAPITAQYGGVPAGVARQGTLDEKKRVEEIRKEQEKKEAESASIVAAEGNDRSQSDFVANTAENTEKAVTMENIKERSMEKQKTEEVKSSEEKSVEAEPKKSTIGDDVVIDKLRAILGADKEYQTVLALLGEADPSKLRSNILFNPEYKVIADLLKQIVRFKVEQYAKGLEEVRGEGKSKDVAPAAAVGKDEAEEKPVEKTEEESEEKGEGDPVSTTVTAPEIATDASKSGSVNETRDVAQGNLLGLSQSPPVRSNINPALFNLPVSQDQTEDTKAKTGEGSEEKSEEKPVGEPEVKTEEKPEEKAQENPFNQFGPNTTPLSTTQVQSTGGVKSRKASRVLRKLKTMKKSKKHTVPLL